MITTKLSRIFLVQERLLIFQLNKNRAAIYKDASNKKLPNLSHHNKLVDPCKIMSTRETSRYLLIPIWMCFLVVLSCKICDCDAFQEEETTLQQSRLLSSSAQTTAQDLTYSLNGTTSDLTLVDLQPQDSEDQLFETSSILKSSHHAPKKTNNYKQQSKTVKLNPEHKESLTSLDKTKRDVIKKSDTLYSRKYPSSLERVQANKKNRLMSFMSQPRKLSFTSLLPIRTNTKQPTSTTNVSQSSPPLASSEVDNKTMFNNLSTTQTFTEEQLNALNADSLFTNSADPFLGAAGDNLVGQQILPYPQANRPSSFASTSPQPPSFIHSDFARHAGDHIQNHNRHQVQPQFVSNPTLRLPNNQMQFSNYDRMISPQTATSHLLGGYHPISVPRTLPDLFVADQSNDNYRRIRLNRMNHFSHSGDSLPLFIASTGSPEGGLQMTTSNIATPVTTPSASLTNSNDTNRASLFQLAAQQLSAAAAIAANQPQHEQAFHQTAQQQSTAHKPETVLKSSSSPAIDSSSGNAAVSALTSVAAAALLSDRAKNFISQLNQVTGTGAQQPATKSNVVNVRNNREVQQESGSEQQQETQNATSTIGLAHMIKNAAEAWATNGNQILTPVATNGPSGATPAIIIEHDGPTVTTVDFNNVPRTLGMPSSQTSPPEEEEEVATFYSETEEAEQEGGSHEAKRVMKPRMYHHGLQGLSETGAGKRPYRYLRGGSSSHHLAGSPRQQQILQHPNFENQNHHQPPPIYQMRPTANEFFEEPHHGSRLVNENPRVLTPAGRAADFNNRPVEYYHQARAPSSKDQYPDSINAIKEQADRTPLSSRRNKQSTASSDDPIESLIKELQELNRKKKVGQDPDSNNPNGKDSSTKISSEDYDDVTNVGSDKEQDNFQDSESPDDEQTRLLRNKLLARLRAKHERKKNSNGSGMSSSSSSSSSSFNNESIRIPLHALLIAALDRRTSSSESKSQSIAQQDSDGLIQLDERSRDLILNGRKDFQDSTADLGSLLEGNNLLERIASRTSHRDSKLNQNQQSASMNDALKLPLNLQNVSQESLTPAGMLLIENLAALDELNQRKFNHSTATNQDTPQTATSTTQSPAVNKTTTPSPLATSTSTTTTTTTGHPSNSDDETGQEAADHQINYRDHARTMRNHQENWPTVSANQKGRRAIRDESDFNLDRQVDDYANDKHDRSLEPGWMKTNGGRRRPNGRRREGTPVDFDDEFDEADRQTRRRMLQQKRRRNNDNPRRQLKDGNVANFEANEQRFLNKMQRDTSAGISDVDQTIKKIEQSIPENESESQRAKRRQQVDPEDADEADEPTSQSGEGERSKANQSDDNDSSASDDGYETSETRNKPKLRANTASWRANMIDDEVRRIEEESKQRRSSKSSNGDFEEGENEQPSEEGAGNENQEAESRLFGVSLIK